MFIIDRLAHASGVKELMKLYQDDKCETSYKVRKAVFIVFEKIATFALLCAASIAFPAIAATNGISAAIFVGYLASIPFFVSYFKNSGCLSSDIKEKTDNVHGGKRVQLSLITSSQDYF